MKRPAASTSINVIKRPASKAATATDVLSAAALARFSGGVEDKVQGFLNDLNDQDQFRLWKKFEASRKIEGAVQSSHSRVANLKSADYFGENALLRNEPRSATIRELGLNEKVQFANSQVLARQWLKNNENIHTMVTLDDIRLKQIAAIAWKEEVAAGKDIIVEGDISADYFYVVQEGTFEIFVEENLAGKKKPNLVQTQNKGGSFGELALLYLVPRAATVTAKTDSIVWVIDRKNFKDILMKVSDEKINEYVKYLTRVEILSSLLAAEKTAVAAALMEVHFAKNQVIIQQGTPGNTFYILFEGEVDVCVDGDEKAKLAASEERSVAHYFGERALLNNEPRAATVRVISDTAKALALDREAFDLLLGPLEEILKRKDGGNAPGAQGAIAPPAGGTPQPKLDTNRQKILRSDLVKIGLLGAGGFGAVELYEHKGTGETYAMKGISKGFIVKTSMQESVITEKNILFMTNSDFIIRLYET
ncbi:unnamed protein product, partial [Polarella glacialis]